MHIKQGWFYTEIVKGPGGVIRKHTNRARSQLQVKTVIDYAGGSEPWTVVELVNGAIVELAWDGLGSARTSALMQRKAA